MIKIIFWLALTVYHEARDESETALGLSDEQRMEMFRMAKEG